MADTTEFRIKDRTIYLLPVRDLFDRSVVSFSVSEVPTLAFADQLLTEAIGTLAPGEAPMMHSGPGVPVPARQLAEAAQ